MSLISVSCMSGKLASLRSDSMEWIAPELRSGEAVPAESSNIYAFGVLLSELDHHTLRAGESTNELVLPSGSSSPSAFASMAKRCLCLNPHERPNAVKIAYELSNVGCSELLFDNSDEFRKADYSEPTRFNWLNSFGAQQCWSHAYVRSSRGDPIVFSRGR